MTLTKRGSTYHIDTALGDRRVRCSLGVRDPKAAERLANRVQFAVADGPRSEVWHSLRQVLPASSYKNLTSGLGLPADSSIREFEHRFNAALDLRVRLGELSKRSRDLYEETGAKFFLWLKENYVRKMDEVGRGMVEKYLVYRKENSPKGRPLAESSMRTEVGVLGAIFRQAIDDGIMDFSPLKGIKKYRPVPLTPEPFTPEEIARLDELEKAPEDDLPYKLFRYTGLRCSDVAEINWKAINWQGKSLKWRTRKRGREVTVPLVTELYQTLKDSHFEGADKILPVGTSQLYRIIKRIGDEAEVQNCHPHKFRTHFICELLGKGASIYDVAAMVGDNVNTIQLYYAAITDKQQERVRGIMEAA